MMSSLTWKLQSFAIYWMDLALISRRTEGVFSMGLLPRDLLRRPKTGLKDFNLLTRLTTFSPNEAWG